MSIINRNSRKYYVISSHQINVGIWDNCYEGLAVRGDGLRARIRLPYVRWANNSGSLDTEVIYIDGREAVKKIVRKLRRAQIWCMSHPNDTIGYTSIYAYLASNRAA